MKYPSMPGRRLASVLVPVLATSMVMMAPSSYAAPPRRPSTSPTPSKRPSAAPTPAPAGPASPELTGDEGGTLGKDSCKRQPRGAKFRITLPKEAELADLVNWMMSVSCQKFIWDPSVRGGKVNVLAPEPVTLEEAYAAFYSALDTMNLTVEPSGKYFKIVEKAGAKTKTLPVYGPDGRAPRNDRFVTQLVRIRSGNEKEIVDLLKNFVTKEGDVQNVGNLLIITDTGSNVRRMLGIARQLDDPKVAGEKIFFFQLRYADPEETAETLRTIFGEGEKKAATGARKPNATDAADPGFSRVVVDDRTGTLIIVAREEDYQVIRRLIEQLDVPLAGGGGRIHVVKLKNADPEEIATVLNQLGSGAQSNQDNRGRTPPRGGGNQPQGDTGPVSAELFSGDIKVTPDPATRSLVILASTADFKALRKVIEELDAERKQLYFEVYLLELNINRDLGAGVGGHFGAPFNTSEGQAVGFVGSAPDPVHNSIILNPALISGLAAGVLGPEIPNSAQFFGQDIPAFGVVIQALETNSDVNFVATPHIYAADNKEASIEIGQKVPTPGAITFGAQPGLGGLGQQSINREDVSLKLKLTPHVNDDETVTLDIELENSDIQSRDPVLGVTTTQRKLKSEKIVARDGLPVVLGGLMQEVERETTNQVPGLGSIPILGWLFKSKQKQRTKVNLLMILVPHVLESPDDVRRIHKRRMEERFEFLERYTAFKRRDLSINVNYRKKAGLLSALNEEATRLSDEAKFRQQAEAELEQQEITGEIGLSPKMDDEEEAEEPKAKAAVEPASSGTRPPRRAQ